MNPTKRLPSRPPKKVAVKTVMVPAFKVTFEITEYKGNFCRCTMTFETKESAFNYALSNKARILSCVNWQMPKEVVE